jgi:hypothetical protein
MFHVEHVERYELCFLMVAGGMFYMERLVGPQL